uniref:Cytochrome P450 n=1 Tax=Meloidogyne javanica TaxID=6303 RepID=A0A915N3C1_MELJA
MPEQCFLRWRRKYGNIFTIWFGEQPQVCVAEFNKIIETFQKDGEAYSGRFTFEEFDKLVRGGTYGIIMTEGEFWRGQRRFALQIFRDFGLGKNLMQDKILSELELLFERIEEEIKQGKDVDFGENIDISVGSIINNFLFGYRFDNERLGEFRQLKKLMDIMLDTGFHPSMIEQLVGVANDLWFAGQETTSTTLNWGIAFLINNPNVQNKVHAELDSIIGDFDRIITTADRPSLPYLNALINVKFNMGIEIQRMANLVPLNVAHKLTKDVKIDGYYIPKDTIIIPQISAVLADGEIFENPEEFSPERFLDENGKLKKVDELIPFSIGKRQCLGEALARMELFLFLGNLLNKYKFMPGNDGIPSLKRFNGGTARCKKFKCRIIKREE